MPGTLSRLARLTRASLRKSLRQEGQGQEPQVADIPGHFQKPWADGLKVSLQGVGNPPPFVHQPAPASRQALEDVVLLRRCHDFLQDIAGHRQVIAELEQLQGLAALDAVALGRGRKDLLGTRASL